MWPDGKPQFEGQLIDLDAGTREVKSIGQGHFTVRVNEIATENGFAWEAPAKDTKYKCIELVNPNLGDYKTGYVQYLYKSLDKDLICEETIKLTRSKNHKDAGKVVDLKIFVEKKACD